MGQLRRGRSIGNLDDVAADDHRHDLQQQQQQQDQQQDQQHQHQHQQRRRRQDKDLPLFQEMQTRESDNFLLASTDDIDEVSLGGIDASAVRDDLGLEPDKSDSYCWLVAPPSTPLFTSLEDGPPEAGIADVPANLSTSCRASTITRGNASPRRLRSPSPCRPSSPKSNSRPATPTRPATPNRPTTPVTRPSRPSTPTRRSATPTSTGPARTSSTTPTRRSLTTSLSDLGSINSRRNARSSSPSAKRITAVHPAMPVESLEPPPNLRTSIVDRPTSNPRGASMSPKAANRSKSFQQAEVNDLASRNKRPVSPSLSRSSSTSSSRSGSVISSVELNRSVISNQAKRQTEMTSPKPRVMNSPGSAKKLSDKLTSSSPDGRRATTNGFRPLMSSNHISSFYSRASLSLQHRSMHATTDSSNNSSSIHESDHEDEVLSKDDGDVLFGEKDLASELQLVDLDMHDREASFLESNEVPSAASFLQALERHDAKLAAGYVFKADAMTRDEVAVEATLKDDNSVVTETAGNIYGSALVSDHQDLTSIVVPDDEATTGEGQTTPSVLECQSASPVAGYQPTAIFSECQDVADVLKYEVATRVLDCQTCGVQSVPVPVECEVSVPESGASEDVAECRTLSDGRAAAMPKFQAATEYHQAVAVVPEYQAAVTVPDQSLLQDHQAYAAAASEYPDKQATEIRAASIVYPEYHATFRVLDQDVAIAVQDHQDLVSVTEYQASEVVPDDEVLEHQVSVPVPISVSAVNSECQAASRVPNLNVDYHAPQRFTTVQDNQDLQSDYQAAEAVPDEVPEHQVSVSLPISVSAANLECRVPDYHAPQRFTALDQDVATTVPEKQGAVAVVLDVQVREPTTARIQDHQTVGMPESQAAPSVPECEAAGAVQLCQDPAAVPAAADVAEDQAPAFIPTCQAATSDQSSAAVATARADALAEATTTSSSGGATEAVTGGNVKIATCEEGTSFISPARGNYLHGCTTVELKNNSFKSRGSGVLGSSPVNSGNVAGKRFDEHVMEATNASDVNGFSVIATRTTAQENHDAARDEDDEQSGRDQELENVLPDSETAAENERIVDHLEAIIEAEDTYSEHDDDEAIEETTCSFEAQQIEDDNSAYENARWLMNYVIDEAMELADRQSGFDLKEIIMTRQDEEMASLPPLKLPEEPVEVDQPAEPLSELILTSKYSSSLMEVYQFDQELHSKVSEVETTISVGSPKVSAIDKDELQHSDSAEQKESLGDTPAAIAASTTISKLEPTLRDTSATKHYAYSATRKKDYSKGSSSSYFSIQMNSSKGGCSISSRPFSTDDSHSSVDTPRSFLDEDDTKSDDSYVDYYVVEARSEPVLQPPKIPVMSKESVCDIPATGCVEPDEDGYVDYYIDDSSSQATATASRELQIPQSCDISESKPANAAAAAEQPAKADARARNHSLSFVRPFPTSPNLKPANAVARGDDDDFDVMVECWKQQEEACSETEERQGENHADSTTPREVSSIAGNALMSSSKEDTKQNAATLNVVKDSLSTTPAAEIVEKHHLHSEAPTTNKGRKLQESTARRSLTYVQDEIAVAGPEKDLAIPHFIDWKATRTAAATTPPKSSRRWNKCGCSIM